MKKIILIFSLSNIIYSNEVIIIIPGTWASNETWHKPGGNFFESVAQNNKNRTLVTFNWSCKNDFESRKKAARELKNLIYTYTVDTNIYIVAHSHGGNVGILASQLLENEIDSPKIKAFLGLGIPVEPEEYFPNMDRIDHFFNFFSFNDFIQPVFGMFYRIYPYHERIINIETFINYKEPTHMEMHNPIIGKWLFFAFEKIVKKINKNNISARDIIMIRFFEKKKPIYKIDKDIEKKIEVDRNLNLQLLNIIVDFRKNYVSTVNSSFNSGNFLETSSKTPLIKR